MNTQRKFAVASALTIVFLVVCANPAKAQRNGGTGATTSPRAQPLVPAGQIARYVVTNMVSDASVRITTAVTVTNNSPVACGVSVDWFLGDGNLVCTTTRNLAAGETRSFCSRNAGGTFVACDVVCSPELDGHEGRAQVASTNSANCAKIAVDARIFFGNGSDSNLSGVHGPPIVKKGLGNSGD